MYFDVSPVKVQELARIADVTQPAISQKFKDESSGGIKNERNRIIGITSKAIQDYLTTKGQEHIYKGGAYLITNCCAGTGKSSSVLALGAAFRRISDPDRVPIIFCDYDSQSSLTSVLTGSAIPDDRPVLINYFEGKAKLEDILTQVGKPEDNLWVIGSNLNNLFLEKALGTPQSIRVSMKRLAEEIFKKFGNRTKIFFDSPPALSNVTSSLICALSELQEKYDTKLILPLRSDRFSYNGAKLTLREKESILSAFNLKDFRTVVFLSAFDKRLKISMDIFKQLIEDSVLKDFVSSVVIRYSTEVSKSHQNNRSIFHTSNSPVGEDYTDLMLYVMGYKRTGTYG